jgi:hypothetical protein
VNIDFSAYADTQRAMEMVIGGILCVFEYAAEPFGSGGAWLVTGHPERALEVGR